MGEGKNWGGSGVTRKKKGDKRGVQPHRHRVQPRVGNSGGVAGRGGGSGGGPVGDGVRGGGGGGARDLCRVPVRTGINLDGSRSHSS